MDTVGSSAFFDTIVAVYQGTTVSSLTRLAEDASFGNPNTRLTFPAQTGQTYRFAVDGLNGEIGRIVLNWRASPPPANDAFAGAILISGATNTVTGDNTFATEETGEPDHGDTPTSKSLWWRWTSPANSAAVVDCSGPFQSTVGIYTGSTVSALSPVPSTGAFPPRSRRGFAARSGVTYRIAVDSAAADSGSFSLDVRTIPPPTNNNFASAVTVSGTNIVIRGSVFGGTLETAEPAHGGDVASVWYRWTAPRTGRVRVSSDQRSDVYSGTQLANLTLISRDTPQDYPRIDVFDAVASTQYYVAVTGSPAEQSAFFLAFDYAPANDDFANAVPLAGVSSHVQGTTFGASLEMGEPITEIPLSANSIWWVYTAPASGSLEFNQRGFSQASRVPVIWVYEGKSVSNLTFVANNHVPGTRDPAHVRCTFSCPVIGSTTYYIAATGQETNLVFDMTLNYAPPNDAFASRLTVEPTAPVTFSTTVGARREPSEPGTGSNSVWWSWTVPQPETVILTTYGSACDTVLSVYVGNTLSTLGQVVRNDDCFIWTTNGPNWGWTANSNSPQSDVTSRIRLNADNGVQYKIAVSVAPTNQPAGEVTLNFTKVAIEDITAVHRDLFPIARRTFWPICG